MVISVTIQKKLDLLCKAEDGPLTIVMAEAVAEAPGAEAMELTLSLILWAAEAAVQVMHTLQR
jgi:hypothetical protein